MKSPLCRYELYTAKDHETEWMNGRPLMEEWHDGFEQSKVEREDPKRGFNWDPYMYEEAD